MTHNTLNGFKTTYSARKDIKKLVVDRLKLYTKLVGLAQTALGDSSAVEMHVQHVRL